jgi:Inward rectifier potassium channel transmembrane domain/Inward rectifier potassium channel C-terminal domain
MKRVWDNWFHYLAGQPTASLLLILFLVYTVIVILFALLYLGVATLGQQTKAKCEMGVHSGMEALYLSLSTMASIGYGGSSYYSAGCWTPLFLVLAQIFCALSLESLAIGLLLQRFSRGQKRAKTIIFSNNAVVQRIQGVPYLMFRMGELRPQHQLIDASVRAYAIRHERHPVERLGRTVLLGVQEPKTNSQHESVLIQTTHYVTKPIKLLHETLSDRVLMSLPQVLVHRIDEESPLRPAHIAWYDRKGHRHEYPWAAKSASERESGMQLDHIHDSANEWAETRRFLQDTALEIVILVEGSDDLTGSAIQTRHSYTVQNLRWDETLTPCITSCTEYDRSALENAGKKKRCVPWNHWSHQPPAEYRPTTPVEGEDGEFHQVDEEGECRNPTAVVDLGLFHETHAAPLNSEYSPYVPQTCRH